MKKLLVGLVTAAAVTVGAAGVASADVSTNGTTKDAVGYATANAIHNFVQPAGEHGIGSYRSQESGQTISERNQNRPADWVTSQGVNGPGVFAPISNNG